MADEICSEANHTIKFIWIEFLNPGDGIAFHHVATKCKNVVHWENLLTKAAADLNYDRNEIGFPVPDLELDDSFVVWEKNLPEIQLIRGGYIKNGSGYKYYGNVGYPNFTSHLEEASWLHTPKVTINMPDGQTTQLPHVYILSGHGGLGRVFGDANMATLKGKRKSKNQLNLGKTSLHLIKFSELRLLIIPACTQAAYCRGEDWLELMANTNCFAILGFDGKYPGSFYGAKVMETFLTQLDFGSTILDAWRTATGKDSTWGAFFLEGTINYKIQDILYPKNSVDQKGRLLHFSKEHSALAYKSPSITAVYRTYHSSADYVNETNKFLAQTFRSIINEVEDHKRNYLAQSESVLWIKNTDGSEFRPGTKLYFRYFLFRPDHPDNFSLDKVFTLPKSKNWSSLNDDAEIRVADEIRDDLVCCTIKSITKCIQFVMNFKPDSLEYLCLAMDTDEPALSMACALGNHSNSEMKNPSFWGTDKVVDLRILSLMFKGQ